MTQRLYYEDAYLTEFDAQVCQCRREGERYFVCLDRSAFYPTSGGQPCDEGELGGNPVRDVFVDAQGEVWHALEAPLEVGARVRGKIDWARRFDHMQQHAGEHMLANAVWRQLGGGVIGLHLGAEFSSIDADLPQGCVRPSAEALRALEDDVNAHIQQNLPIVCTFPDAQTLAAMPLRKPPTVKEHIRIVNIGNYEYVACGGTHPSSTGQIGLLKILDARPARGKVRFSFVCGMRAVRDYQAVFSSAHAAAASLSTGVGDLVGAVESLQRRVQELGREAAALRRERLFARAPEMLAGAAALPGGGRLVVQKLDADMPLLREMASRLIQEKGVIALLAAPQEGQTLWLVFARASGMEADMGQLLSRCARLHGGKGGGRADFAQGAGPQEVLASASGALLRA